ncbi:MAG: hypothetical protein B7X86_13940 [Sphingobacteriales bacterium 17-39-43]|uniref:hypothetical protein n=1 Tax=Daejeonella sp. TaxID=2805397 RepID=UPI000BDDB5E3|nr:hypothetical protein [Daejeonella sp.]OYZ30169.1 MAG: hypothetical protein B7Y24_13705 [Sphingobacteriales bacterium 16-39-50]OZA22912.1 MAG: hypothetical protein B7X86_13940 [Sphingobacteriales bacterium 17-39-43]HQS05854.1 hypothetical protein [Daejeonella sp.]HQT58807.1 hypothetical protein [Daejeonella sp.]
MIKEETTRCLNNFLSSYTLQESTEMLSQVYNHIEGVHFSAINNSKKEQVLDFLEALEELLPAVYELHE